MHDDENYRYVTKKGYIDLTVSENCILRELIKHKGSITTFETLCLAVYRMKADKALKNNIRIQIARLKKKLKGEIQIMNKKHVGYFIFACNNMFCNKFIKIIQIVLQYVAR